MQTTPKQQARRRMVRGAARIARASLVFVLIAPSMPPALGQQDAAPAAQAPSAQGPAAPVVAEPVAFEMGDMLPGTSRTMKAVLRNSGDAPITISQARSTCQCTLADLPEKVIPAGGTVPITVTFEAGKYMGKSARQVIINFEGYKRPLLMDVKADINYGIRPLVKYVPEGQYRTGEVSLTAADGKPFRIIGADGAPPVYLDGFDPRTMEPRSEYRIRLDVSRYSEEELPKWFLIETDHATACAIDLRLVTPRARPGTGGTHSGPNNQPVRPGEPGLKRTPWVFMEDRALVWRLPPEGSAEVEMVMKGARVEQGIDSVTVIKGSIDAALSFTERHKEGTLARFTITVKPGATGLIDATVRVRSGNFEQDFDVFGRVDPSLAGRTGDGKGAGEPGGAGKPGGATGAAEKPAPSGAGAEPPSGH